MLALIAVVILRRTWWPLGGYVLMYALLLSWWSTIVPTNHRVWADDVSRLLTSTVHGSMVTLHNVRDFTWHSADDYDEHWVTQSYDLDQLVSADAVLSHWGSQAIAHAMISFGFDDGRHLVFSVEIRKRRGQKFSSIGGFFKNFESILIASPESDIVRVRTNVRRRGRLPLPAEHEPRRDARAVPLVHGHREPAGGSPRVLQHHHLELHHHGLSHGTPARPRPAVGCTPAGHRLPARLPVQDRRAGPPADTGRMEPACAHHRTRTRQQGRRGFFRGDSRAVALMPAG
ncbi:hypothetical protein UU5_02212 [Rhodanobacter sp. 115]|nr:hypothetical protein UU5_02212 [Rhodanobacter sp. 115]